MKKILTFLVMLFASVSILSAQTDYVPKFSYQAVVRDINKDLNLVVEKECTVEVTILEGADTAYTETLTGTTNRNGMISLVIGENGQGKALDSINWSISSIFSTFKVDGDEVSRVQTAVMAVPFALQAHSAPLEITTESICKYISTMSADNNKNDVDSILAAMAANADVWNYVKDTVKKYIKAHKSDVKDLALYFLNQVTPEDLEKANDTVSEAVKTKVKQLVKDYAINHRKEAFDILANYISTATVHDFDTLWKELRSSDKFDTLFNMAQDSIIEYIKTHKDLVIEVAEAWVMMVNTDDIQHMKSYIQQNKSDIYDYVVNRFHDYLFNYLTTKFYAVSDSCFVKDIEHNSNGRRLDICEDVVDPILHLQGLANEETCDGLTVSQIQYNTLGYYYVDVTNETTKSILVQYKFNDGSWQTLTDGISGTQYQIGKPSFTVNKLEVKVILGDNYCTVYRYYPVQ